MLYRLALLLCLVTTPVAAEDWRSYSNFRFGYAVELPEDFAVTHKADNGDGMALASTDSKAELRVFGANRMEDDFTTEIKSRMALDKGEGWTISYQQSSKRGASYSGSRKDRILYVRAIPLCDATVGYFTLEYPQAQLKQYDPVIKRLVKTLVAPPRCQ
ncbi:hypothetical protein [Rhizobium sp. S163]|uniref:hypothetical protein n=1 Tax=Rhizobium sp. S163 TaxID=3055039 RepID=UPI0025A98091|nr:hypothetical protein [Rhizobium sp. S163]MDM9647934.1 hypothetical protein [Rhizobium sp. S163]